MNTIRFERCKTGDGGIEVRIVIDDRDLVDHARAVEAPQAAAEGAPDIAGTYVGLPWDDVCPPSRHYFGKPLTLLDAYGDRTQVLRCTCRESGCWPMTCRIAADDEVVTWSDFEQPHRSARSGSRWLYEGLGPFQFARSEFERALNALCGTG